MDPVSFILFVLFGLVGIFVLYRFSKYASVTIEEEQEKTQNGLHDNGPQNSA